MKNGLILFFIILPLSLLNDFIFDRENPLLSTLEVILPPIIFLILIKRNMSSFSLETFFKEILKFTIITSFFYAIWIGFYQYLITQFFKPEILEAQLELIKSTAFFGKNFTEEELATQFEMYKSPIYWIFSALFLYSVLFSIIGLIFGYLYKSKVKQQ